MDNIVEVAQEVDRHLATWCSECGKQCKSVADSFSYSGDLMMTRNLESFNNEL